MLFLRRPDELGELQLRYLEFLLIFQVVHHLIEFAQSLGLRVLLLLLQLGAVRLAQALHLVHDRLAKVSLEVLKDGAPRHDLAPVLHLVRSRHIEVRQRHAVDSVAPLGGVRVEYLRPLSRILIEVLLEAHAGQVALPPELVASYLERNVRRVGAEVRYPLLGCLQVVVEILWEAFGDAPALGLSGSVGGLQLRLQYVPRQLGERQLLAEQTRRRLDSLRPIKLLLVEIDEAGHVLGNLNVRDVVEDLVVGRLAGERVLYAHPPVLRILIVESCVLKSVEAI